MLTDTGVDGRVLTEGDEHEGIDLRFNGESHPLDFKDLVDATVTLYAQNEVFVDLAAARKRDGGDVRYEAEVTEVLDLETTRPSSALPTRTAPPLRCTATSWSVPTAPAVSAAVRCGEHRTTRSSTRSRGSAS